jgi:hypothetical protein
MLKYVMLCYSWDNHRNGARILARLERFYVSGEEGNKLLLDDYRIRGDSDLSEHLLVCLSLTLKKCDQQGACYKMNSSLLKVPEVKTKIVRLWNSYPDGIHFLVKYRRVIRFYRRFCQQHAESKRRREMELRYNLDRLQGELQRDPCNSGTQSALE